MHARHLVVAISLLAAATAAQAQTTFAYRYEQPTNYRFAFADTVESTMDTPMGPLSSRIGMTGMYRLQLTPRADSTHARLEVSDFKGSMEAMGQSMAMPQPDIEPIELMLGRSGSARASAPGLGAAGVSAGVGNLSALTGRMFVRLPEQPVSIGATWTDTIAEVMDTAGLHMTVNGTSRNTYVADTTVDGRRLHRVRVVTEAVIKASGDAGGQQVTQDMKTTGTADWLWDPQRRIFVSMHGETSTTGTMNMSAMGAINMNAKMTSRMRLADN